MIHINHINSPQYCNMRRSIITYQSYSGSRFNLEIRAILGIWLDWLHAFFCQLCIDSPIKQSTKAWTLRWWPNQTINQSMNSVLMTQSNNQSKCETLMMCWTGHALYQQITCNFKALLIIPVVGRCKWMTELLMGCLFCSFQLRIPATSATWSLPPPWSTCWCCSPHGPANFPRAPCSP